MPNLVSVMANVVELTSHHPKNFFVVELVLSCIHATVHPCNFAYYIIYGTLLASPCVGDRDEAIRKVIFVSLPVGSLLVCMIVSRGRNQPMRTTVCVVPYPYVKPDYLGLVAKPVLMSRQVCVVVEMRKPL